MWLLLNLSPINESKSSVEVGEERQRHSGHWSREKLFFSTVADDVPFWKFFASINLQLLDNILSCTSMNEWFKSTRHHFRVGVQVNPQSEIKWVPEHCELRIFLRLWMTISEKCFIFQDFLLNKPQLFFGFVCCPKVSMILNSYVKSYDQKIGVKKSWVRSAQVFLLLNREFHSVFQSC